MDSISIGLSSVACGLLGFLGGYWFREWREFSRARKKVGKMAESITREKILGALDAVEEELCEGKFSQDNWDTLQAIRSHLSTPERPSNAEIVEGFKELAISDKSQAKRVMKIRDGIIEAEDARGEG